MKAFDNGVIVGRFQHIHVGHEKLINIGLSLCNKLVVFVSSADKLCTIRNPFDIKLRIKLINKIFEKEIKEGKLIVKPLNDLTIETDLTPEWGKYVVSSFKEILNTSPNCIIYGKDKDINKCFSKDLVSNISEVFVDRKSLEISATDLREFLKSNNEIKWKKYTNIKIHDEYNNLKKLINMEDK